MVDVFTKAKRSAIMARVKGENTKPEILIRKLVHGLGYRFRLHNSQLPGKPDVVLARHRKIIFVHGCFWHGHARCRRAALPATNVAFWQKKIEGNKARDKRVKYKLTRLGWDVLVVWQCHTSDVEKLTDRLRRFVESS